MTCLRVHASVDYPAESAEMDVTVQGVIIQAARAEIHLIRHPQTPCLDEERDNSFCFELPTPTSAEQMAVLAMILEDIEATEVHMAVLA